MDIAHIHQELIPEIHEGMMLAVGGSPMAKLGDVFELLEQQFEALAICHLLESADTSEFRENLVRSGHSRRYFLQHSRVEGNDRDRYLALGRTPAFLDVLVAGAGPLAAQIADLSTGTWNPNWEYEDDFCFFLFLHELAKRPAPFPNPEVEALLDRFKRSLEGGASCRYDVCAGIVRRDALEFSEALRARLDEEESRIEADRDSAAVHEGDMLYWPRSYVSIEGLALLRAAELVGLRVEGDFPRCPAIARLPVTGEPSRDVFDELSRML